MREVDFTYLAWGSTIILSRRGSTPGAVAQRLRASQRLKAVTPEHQTCEGTANLRDRGEECEEILGELGALGGKTNRLTLIL